MIRSFATTIGLVFLGTFFSFPGHPSSAENRFPSSPSFKNRTVNHPIDINSGASELIHPGGWLTKKDIRRIRNKVRNNAEPWITAMKQLMSVKPDFDYEPSAWPVVDRGTTNTNLTALNKDVESAYTLMVKWVATNDNRYGDAAIRIIDEWSGTLRSITGKDARLAAGIDGSKFAQAAEIAAYFNPKWPYKSRAQQMFKNVFFPVCWNNGKGASSNWGTSCMAGIMSFAVFCDDRSMFDQAVNAYKFGWPITGSDGCAGVAQYINENGQCAESGRDQPHTQGGIAHLIETAVTAWNQNVNLFSYAENRTFTGLEYCASYNLGNTVEWHPFIDPCNLNNRWPSISDHGRGRYSPIYEMAYNYFKLTGMPVNFVKQVRDSNGYAPESTNLDHPGWGTLCFTR